MAEPEIERITRDGVPVLWIRDARTPRLTLVFRTGRADENPAQLGINHLIEHLVLGAIGEVPYDINGLAGPLLTSFQAVGTPEQLASYLDAVGAHLRELPTDALATERRILALERSEYPEEPSVMDALLALRWGSTPLGRLGHPEMGLLTLTADELRDWARAHFTRAAAVLCWSGSEPPPEGLRLPLPEGSAIPLPPDLADPVTLLPLAAPAPEDADAGVAISAVIPDDGAHLLAVLVQRERLQRRLRSDLGAAYSVHFSWDDLLPGRAHVSWTAPVDERTAARSAQAAVDDLMGDWPTQEVTDDVARVRRGLLDDLTDPATRHGVLIDEALRQLTGLPRRSLADRISQLEAVDPAAIEVARRSIQATAIVHATAQLPHPGRPFHELTDDEPLGADHAVVFETKGLRRSRRDRLTIAASGLQYEVPGEPPAVIRWTDLVSAVRDLDGTWSLTSRTGSWVLIALILFKDAAAVDAALDARVPAAARHAAIGEGKVDEVQARAAADLTDKERGRLGDDLTALAVILEPDEDVVRVAEATRGIKSGVLAITDTRTIHLFVGSLTTDLPHSDLTGLRIEHPISGVRLVLQTADESVAFGGGTHSAEFVAVRDLLDELRHPGPPA